MNTLKAYQIRYEHRLIGESTFETGDSPQAILEGVFYQSQNNSRAATIATLLSIIDDNLVQLNDDDFLVIVINHKFLVNNGEMVRFQGGMLTIPKSEQLEMRIEIMCDDREQFDRLFQYINDQYEQQFER